MGKDREFEHVTIKTHRQLMARRKEVFRRLEARPHLAAMFFVNPVLALKDLGVELTPELRRHVLESVRHPPQVASRRAALEAKLEKELGEAPRPTDGKWLAALLFERLGVEPRKTRGLHPPYRSALPEGTLERLEPVRQRLRERRSTPRGRAAGTRIRLVEWRDSYRRLDLDAPAPELERADEAPRTMSLGTLFFYKDAHPLARDLLELGVIMKSALPLHHGGSYRAIRDGEKPNAFRSWITGLRFPAEP